MNNIHYYKPSGKFSPIIYAYLLLSILVIAPLLSVGYAYSIAYMPFRIINIAIFAITAFLLFMFIYFMLENAKVRNTLIVKVFSSIIFIWFYYLHWSAWLYFLLQDIDVNVMTLFKISNSILPSVLELSLHPSLMWKFATELIDFWSGITWIIELMILGWLLFADLLNDPFSELSNKWHDEQSFTIETVSKEELMEAISNFDYGWFKEMQNMPIVYNNSHTKLKIYTSPTFDNYLDLEYYEAIVNTDGKPDFNEKQLITRIAINKEITNIILDLVKVKNVHEIDVGEDNKKIITDNQELIIDTNSESIIPIDIITTPEIIININKGKVTSRWFGIFVTILFGIGLLMLGVSWDLTEGLIFGGLILVGGVSSFIMNIIKEEDDSFAFIINPTYIHVSTSITVSDKNEIIPLNEIKEISTKVSRDGIVTLILIFNTLIINDETYFEIDIELADIDWKIFETKLKLFINKNVEERKELVNNWYTLLKK